MGCITQKGDLLPIPATPFAKQQMHPQAKSLAKREIPVKRGGLQAGRVFAPWRQVGNPSCEGFHHFCRPTHFVSAGESTDFAANYVMCHTSGSICNMNTSVDRRKPYELLLSTI